MIKSGFAVFKWDTDGADWTDLDGFFPVSGVGGGQVSACFSVARTCPVSNGKSSFLFSKRWVNISGSWPCRRLLMSSFSGVSTAESFT